MIQLRSINRIVQWLGFVVVVGVDDGSDPDKREPTRIGLVWIGWPPDRGWARHCEQTKRKAIR